MELKAISLDRAFGVMDGIAFILESYDFVDAENVVGVTQEWFQDFCRINGIDLVFE